MSRCVRLLVLSVLVLFALTTFLSAQNVYVLNVGLSLQSSYYTDGAFKVYNSGDSGLSQVSAAWFRYTGTGLPTGVQDNVVALGALSGSDWQFVQSDSTALYVNPGDYVLVRIFPADGTVPSNSKLKVTMVFGRGTSTPDHSSVAFQSPLKVASTSSARPVIDTDNSSASTWPTPTGSDNAWTYCVGKIQNVGTTADFVLNLGVTISPSGSTQYIFGHDPQLHVVLPG